MAKPTAEPAPPHEFPFWPLDCMTFYSHAIRDFGRYGQAMSKVNDPAQALRAEGAYGLNLWQDMMQAYYDLAVLPMTLAAKAAASAEAEAEPDQPARPAAE